MLGHPLFFHLFTRSVSIYVHVLFCRHYWKNALHCKYLPFSFCHPVFDVLPFSIQMKTLTCVFRSPNHTCLMLLTCLIKYKIFFAILAWVCYKYRYMMFDMSTIHNKCQCWPWIHALKWLAYYIYPKCSKKSAKLNKPALHLCQIKFQFYLME